MSEQGESHTVRNWVSVGILLIMYALAFVDRQIIGLMVDPIKADLGVTDFQISLFQGVAFGLCFAVFGLPLGWFADHLPRRGVIYVGVTLWSIAATACGLAASWIQLLVARFMVGVGEAALSPAAYSIISDLFPPRRLALALAVFSTGATIGAAAAILLGGQVISWLEAAGGLTLPWIGTLRPWQAAFVITGAPGILIAFLIFVIHDPVRPGRVSARAAFRELLVPGGGLARLKAFLAGHRRFFSCHFVGFGLLSCMGYAILSWMPTHLIRTFHMDVGTVSIHLAVLLVVTTLPGGVISGIIVDRLFAAGRKDAHMLYFFVGSLILTIFGSVAFIADSLWQFYALLAVGQLFVAFPGVATSALQLATPRQIRGQVSALYLFVYNLIAMTLGGTLVAIFTDFVYKDDAAIGYSVASALLVLGPLAAVLLWLGRRPMWRAIEAMEADPKGVAHQTN